MYNVEGFIVPAISHRLIDITVCESPDTPSMQTAPVVFVILVFFTSNLSAICFSYESARTTASEVPPLAAAQDMSVPSLVSTVLAPPFVNSAVAALALP